MLATPPTSRRGPRKAARASASTERSSIALVGFMGSGKTSVGKLLAERLGVTFVDLDEVIAASAGRSIPEIFRDFGEVGFRARERAALRDVLARRGTMVIATGGGTFADPAMREWLLGATRTVFLQTSAETLIERMNTVEHRARRPLLRGPDPAKTIRRLLAERTEAYEQSELEVPTDGCRTEDIVDAIVRALRLDGGAPATSGLGASASSIAGGRADAARGRQPKRPTTRQRQLTVRATSGDYVVSLRAAAGSWLAEEVARLCPGRKVALFSDEHVAPLHADRLISDLRDVGKQVSVHVVPPGEDSKSLAVAERLYDELLDVGLDREDAVIALGGGVVGDLAGFVASTFLRGIACVQVPTSTLAAVDSSVGGKTGVNTRRGKNLVGTFSQPRAVLIAGAHLVTQPRRVHAAGLAEVVKIAATLDAELFRRVADDARALLDFDVEAVLDVVQRAVELKAEVVSADERERGVRMVLNYGHTIGHAIEVGEAYELLHGEAVALGMVAEAEWAQAERLGGAIAPELVRALHALELPTEWRRARVDVEALKVDKKRLASTVRLPVVTEPGSYELRTVPMTALIEYVSRRSSR